MERVLYLSAEFTDAYYDYYRKVLGASQPERWRKCVETVNQRMKFATGRMYVEEKFAGDSKTNVRNIVI